MANNGSNPYHLLPIPFFNFFFKKDKQNPESAQYICMKHNYLSGIAFFVVLLAACSDGPKPATYRPYVPVVPNQWHEILGDPHWRLEWIGEEGAWRTWEGAPDSEPPAVSPPAGWTTPILAWPFWPEAGLAPGIMRPCGAFFPWDVSGGSLILSWEGGVGAVFWKELALAERTGEAAQGRLPWYFDWPRFRELLENGDIPENVRADPWLADWKEIGGKTVASGFDRRRIAARRLSEVSVPGLEGSWVSSSPFTPPLEAPPGGPLLLQAAATPDTWVSTAGVLRCSTLGWVLRRW